jgi:hypothetical protein
MKVLNTILFLMLPALPMSAGDPGGAVLEYRLQVRMREDPRTLEGGVRLVTTPALRTRNKVQKPRMGGWRIEPEATGGAALPRSILARALGLCYFSGPTAQVVPLDTGMKLDGRWCRLWRVELPPGLGAYAYLAEVAPNLLALAYLSATLPDPDVRSMEIHLTKVRLGPGAAPAEEGTALLKTLQHWAAQPVISDHFSETLETEAVP